MEIPSSCLLGSSRGIGAAIMHRFARDGEKVVFTYFSSLGNALVLAAET